MNNLAAANFVSKGYDIIIAIATPSAMSAHAAPGCRYPVVFSVVCDPVAAGLVKSLDNPQTGATGTSDSLNFEGQLKMIRAFLPDAKKLASSIPPAKRIAAQLESLKEAAKDFILKLMKLESPTVQKSA